jgi:isopentenyl-diphosphate delta-isomerase
MHSIHERKDDHISLCLSEKVEYYSENSSFASFVLEHDALPELDFDAIDLSTEFLGKKLQAPLIIGAMTGGTKRAQKINERLSLIAEKTGIALALGSQRPMLTDANLKKSYAMREFAPNIPVLLGNLGAVQLQEVSPSQIQDLIQATDCDGFYFHLNPLQEILQIEGNRNFSHLLEKLQKTIPELQVPVFIKEIGCGISQRTAWKLKDLPLHGIETAGVGGTSWAKIESLRSQKKLNDPLTRSLQENLGETFRQWGVPTCESILICKNTLPHLKLIASGGIRNGVEASKALALGADLVAFALPLLKAAEISLAHAEKFIEQIKQELKIALFLTGQPSVKEFKKQAPAFLKKRSQSS